VRAFSMLTCVWKKSATEACEREKGRLATWAGSNEWSLILLICNLYTVARILIVE
jgi:hypothetical protein